VLFKYHCVPDVVDLNTTGKDAVPFTVKVETAGICASGQTAHELPSPPQTPHASFTLPLLQTPSQPGVQTGGVMLEGIELEDGGEHAGMTRLLAEARVTLPAADWSASA